MTLGKRLFLALTVLFFPPDAGRADRPADVPTPGELTAAEMEEQVAKLAERREKLAYFYISAFTAILVFTFNNFNSRSGILVRAPVWLVELGWGALIVAALCPLYIINIGLKRFAMNFDRLAGKKFDLTAFSALRRHSQLADRAMTLFFLLGVGSLCSAYALGLNQVRR